MNAIQRHHANTQSNKLNTRNAIRIDNKHNKTHNTTHTIQTSIHTKRYKAIHPTQ